MFTMGEVYLGYRSQVKASEAAHVGSSEGASDLFRRVWEPEQLGLRESFKAIFLSRSNRAICHYPLSEGGVSGTVVDVRLLLQAAILANASGMIICHNHPSGNLSPSDADRAVTRRIGEAAKLFDIVLLDHLILTEEGYYSFADGGLL